jgi:hypothetical protein
MKHQTWGRAVAKSRASAEAPLIAQLTEGEERVNQIETGCPIGALRDTHSVNDDCSLPPSLLQTLFTRSCLLYTTNKQTSNHIHRCIITSPIFKSRISARVPLHCGASRKRCERCDDCLSTNSRGIRVSQIASTRLDTIFTAATPRLRFIQHRPALRHTLCFKNLQTHRPTTTDDRGCTKDPRARQS